MLESRRLVVRERGSARRREVFDPDGDPHAPVGVAEDVTGPVGRFLGRTTRIEVRELPDESLVFTVGRGVLPRSRVEVRDAQGGLVGSFDGEFRIRTADGRPFAGVVGGRVLTAAGVEIGRLSQGEDGDCIEMAEELDGQPLAKMLVVAAGLTRL